VPGVPARVPVLSNVIGGGIDPAEIDQVYGWVPPVAVKANGE